MWNFRAAGSRNNCGERGGSLLIELPQINREYETKVIRRELDLRDGMGRTPTYVERTTLPEESR